VNSTDAHGIPLELKRDKAFRQLARQVSREHRPSIVPADELWPETFERWNAGERAKVSFEESQRTALAALLRDRPQLSS
jgi:hypothetical protein